MIELETHNDERGFFARAFCAHEFSSRGLCDRFVQSSISFNLKAGTLRGMHWQAAPHEECKLIRCTRGALYDVIIDMRTDSPTRDRWLAFELTAENRRQLYVPMGFAHGFQTLADATEVHYEISAYYAPAAARGVRWDDPAFAIEWPRCEERTISARDASYPDYKEVA